MVLGRQFMLKLTILTLLGLLILATGSIGCIPGVGTPTPPPLTYFPPSPVGTTPLPTYPPLPTLAPIKTLPPAVVVYPTEGPEEPIPTQGPILFSDNFSDPLSGWTTHSDQTSSSFYQDGWLHIRDNVFGPYSELSQLGKHFSDFILEVETKLVDGSDLNWHMVICRWSGGGGGSLELISGGPSYYVFGISADGYYEVGGWYNGIRMDFPETPVWSNYINRGKNVVNLMRVECVGSILKLSVNGHLLTTVTDSTLTGGDIRLGANCPGDDYNSGRFTEVAFDNLVIYAP